ncbi:rRNA methyltransferase 1, mitochondrial-like [Glandiceps talaboti]
MFVNICTRRFGSARSILRLGFNARKSSTVGNGSDHAVDQGISHEHDGVQSDESGFRNERFDLTPSTKARNRVTMPAAPTTFGNAVKTVTAKRRSQITRQPPNQARENMMAFEKSKRIIEEDDFRSKRNRQENGETFYRRPKSTVADFERKGTQLINENYNFNQDRDIETRSGDLLDIEEEGFGRSQRKNLSTPSWKRERPATALRTYRKGVVKYKPKDGNDMLFGISPCIIALMENRREIYQVFIKKGLLGKSKREELQQIHSLCRDKGLELKEVDKINLDDMSGGRPHQGICMEVSRLYFESLSEEENTSLQELSGNSDVKICVALDQIKDPMNFGAILRSSYFMGVDKVISSKKNCCPLTPVVSKASAGTMEAMKIYTVPKLSDLLQNLSDHGWDIIGTCNLSSENLLRDKPVIRADHFQLEKPTVLVLGNEGYGVRGEVLHTCSKLIAIPPGRQLHPHVDSLNVSVVTGILLYALLQGRPTS